MLFEGVTHIEWQLAIDMQYLDRAVDGVHVDEAYCPWRGSHSSEDVFIASDYFNHRTNFIDLGDGRLGISRGNSKKLLHRDMHFRGGWIF